MKRVLNHLLFGQLTFRKLFTPEVLDAISAHISRSELSHSGQLRCAIEASFTFRDLIHGITPRSRAIKLFSSLGVWDTDRNNGILIYLLVAERTFHIIADRGIMTSIPNIESSLNAISTEMSTAFKEDEFLRGLSVAVDSLTALLVPYFPPSTNQTNELGDFPIIV